jgi:CRISPR/Cas system CMR subunit Cmr4 (Cas7 group RAMP superfamily)
MLNLELESILSHLEKNTKSISKIPNYLETLLTSRNCLKRLMKNYVFKRCEKLLLEKAVFLQITKKSTFKTLLSQLLSKKC